jgi:hypothetical protein
MRARAACFWATECGRGCSIKANYQSPTVHLPPALATGNLDRLVWIGPFSGVLPEDVVAKKFLADPASPNARLRLLWLACGQDNSLPTRNEEFVARLKTAGVNPEWHLTSGNHRWPVWRGHLASFPPRIFPPSATPAQKRSTRTRSLRALAKKATPAAKEAPHRPVARHPRPPSAHRPKRVWPGPPPRPSAWRHEGIPPSPWCRHPR